MQSFVNFKTFAELSEIEETPYNEINLESLVFAHQQEGDDAGQPYHEESSIQGNLLSPYNEDSQLLGISDFEHNCTLRSSRPSAVKQMQPVLHTEVEPEDEEHSLELVVEATNAPVSRELIDPVADMVRWSENGGRPRENLATCSAEECKDEQGAWTRWRVERLDEAQR